MSASLLFLRDRSRTSSKLLCKLSFLRHMGGGPRTFPGGLNKWQWKRLHEKKAMEKEKKLLLHEKQLYEARVRSEIRAKLSGPSGRPFPSNAPQSSTHTPMTAKDHVRVLADRFMKQGAEDLWNEDDGPLKSPPARPRRLPGQNPPLDLRKIGSDRRNFESLDHRHHPSSGSEESDFESVTSGHLNERSPLNSRKAVSDVSDESDSDSEGRVVEESNAIGPQLASRRIGLNHGSFSSFARRNYSVEARKPMSRFESRVKQSLSRDNGEFGSKGRGNSRRRRFSNGDSDEDSDSDVEGRVFRKNMMSSAALRNYDVKMTRRQPMKTVEEDNGSSQEIQTIRDELKRRVLDGNAERQCGEEKEESHLSQKRFDECNISPLTIKALSSAGYVQMTAVQEATLPVCLEGKDVLVKAKTGTGKSVAFLLPAIESVLQATSSGRNQRVPPILVLVLSPTRELASQIAAEANVLLKYHVGIGVQTLIGGTRFKVDQKRLESDPCQIIVATPGRLLDHIENRSGFSMRLMGLKVLILDEADHLLDLGFRKDIEKIVDCVPRQRQSLLFSATIPKEVRRVSQLVLKRDHVYVDTVGLGGLETPAKVLQSYFIAPHVQHFQLVYQLLKEHMARVLDYKVIVFCTTAMVTSLMFLLLRELKMNVREIHSRKPQIYRARVSDEFRESKRLSLITSDVSARGMDYPDVTLVIQVGIPSDREQYIHRLGRTGREGKEGECMLVLAPWEEYFLDEIKDLPIEKSSFLRLDPDIKVKVEDCMARIDVSHKEAAYHAWLGYYNSIREIGREKTLCLFFACHLHNRPTTFASPSLLIKIYNSRIPSANTRLDCFFIICVNINNISSTIFNMRFFTVAALALAASVSAQSSASSVLSSVVAASSTTASLSPQQTCLAACAASDICCQAACVNVPCPNEAQVNATTQCAGRCVQGNGTEEETAAYASCQASCISSNFLTATSGVAGAASTRAASATTTGSGSSASHSGSSSGSHSSATATSASSAASASATGNVAPETRAAIAGAGLFGLIVVGLAL